MSMMTPRTGTLTADVGDGQRDLQLISPEMLVEIEADAYLGD